MPPENLNKAIAVGAFWVTSLRLSYRLIGLVSTIILARLLTPEDFGVVAIAMSFFGLIDVFSKFGFHTVLIQTKNPSKDHYSTAWSFNVVFGVISAAVLVAISLPVADFYGNSELEYILMAISLMFFMNGIQNIGVVDFQKNMTFEKEFMLHMIPKFLSFFITIGLAILYENFWALVFGNLAWKAITVVMSYTMHPFRPSLTFNKGQELFGFSKWLMFNNFLTFLNRKTPELFLGKIMSPNATAIFNLAAEIGSMATSEVISNINRAIYPAYSKVSHDIESLRMIYLDSARVISIIALPLGVGVAMVSPLLVPVLLGDQWGEVVDPLVYLALGGALFAMKSNCAYVYFSLGKPKISTIELGIRAFIFLPVMIWMSIEYGIVGAAQSFMIVSVIMFVISNLIIASLIKVKAYELFILSLRPFISVGVMSIFIEFFIHQLGLNPIVMLFLSVFFGGLIYISTLYLLWFLVGCPVGIESKVKELVSNRIFRNKDIS